MPKVVKTTDIPADPKRLYIYLYCDKLGCYKSTTKKKAAKSWLSLSESKRRRFLKTCRLKKDLNDTQRVLSTEPFLKPLYNNNSTVDDISCKNIKDVEQNDSCLDGEHEIQNKTCIDNDDTEQNEICLHEQQKNKTCLDGDNVENNTCLDGQNEEQNEISLDDDNEVQNNTCLDMQNDEQNETCLDGDNEEQNNTYLDGQNEEQNEICLDDDNEVQNNTYLDMQNDEQNETCLDGDNEEQNNTYLEKNNDDAKGQNHSVAIVVDDGEASINNKNQNRDIARYIDVNSICKEINGSDTESLPNIEEQTNQGTNSDETNANNTKTGFINNIKEPIPPTVKNWKELYMILNKDKNIQLQDLNVNDPVRLTYQVLYTKIRKEYIEHYIQYLESLTDEQLYEQYLKES